MKKTRYTKIEEIFQDPTVRAIGIMADVNQGKSNLIYHCIRILQEKYEVNIASYGLHMDVPGMRRLYSVNDLETVQNSVVFIDEFPSLFRLSNKRQMEKFEESMRKVFHHTSNNIVIICGLPHNFNKFLSGLMQVTILKQCTLEDFIQRSPIQQAVISFSPAGMKYASKGNTVLSMPKNVAVIFNPLADKLDRWSEVEIPHEKAFDSKLQFCQPILTPKVKGK
jgi:hypothetical protein